MMFEPPSPPRRDPVVAPLAPRILVIGLVLALVTGPAVVRAAEAPDALHAFIDAYRTTWDTHDASALADYFTEDADFVMANQPAVRGREAVRDWWGGYFARQEPERHLRLDVRSIRSIAADVAIVDVGTTTGGNGRDGRALPERRFRGSWLMRRQAGRWLIATMRGFPREEDRVVLNGTVATAETLRPRIRAFVAAYEEAWNHHDPSALGALYREDAEIVIRNLPPVRGREAIEEWWRSYFAKPRPYRAIFIVDRIRSLTSDVAQIDVTATGALEARSDDRPRPVRSARGTWVVVRDSGAWRLAAMWVLPSVDDRVVRSGGGTGRGASRGAATEPEDAGDTRSTAAAPEASGTLAPAGPPLAPPVRVDAGGSCVVDLREAYEVSGTLSGKLEVSYRILVHGPCEVPPVPGKYDEEWIAHGTYEGMLDGAAGSGTLTYTARVRAGGDVAGRIAIAGDFQGTLAVSGNFGDGQLSYRGHLN